MCSPLLAIPVLQMRTACLWTAPVWNPLKCTTDGLASNVPELPICEYTPARAAQLMGRSMCSTS